MVITTRDVVTEFLKIKLIKRNYTAWLDHNPDDEAKTHEQPINKTQLAEQAKIKKICQLLDRISDDLVEFIEKNGKTVQIKQMVEQLIENFDYENFEAMCDELFSRGVCWTHVVTVLVVAMEFASNAQEVDIKLVMNTDKSDINNLIKTRGQMVWELIDWISNYFKYRVDYWVDYQPGGWMDVKSLDQITNKSSGRSYFSYFAIGILIGTLYMCSKV